jgi:homogentisate 1,2-dioxygenase
MWLGSSRCRIRGECRIVPTTIILNTDIAKEFKAASAQPPPETQISKGAVAFMFESCRQLTITDWAWNSDKKHEHEPKMWDNLVDNFSSHLDEVNEIIGKK